MKKYIILFIIITISSCSTLKNKEIKTAPENIYTTPEVSVKISADTVNVYIIHNENKTEKNKTNM